ncbi:MAG: UPF0182 family protein [Patescibacteria group bacterium]
MRKVIWLAVGLAVLVLVLLMAGTSFFTDWLWFRSMGLTAVFWTAFATGWILRLLAWAVTFTFFFLNFSLALRALRGPHPAEEQGGVWSQLQLDRIPWGWANLAVSALLALLIGSALNPGWAAVQQFLHPVRMGVADPILHRDVSYYLFQFPIWRSLNRLLQTLLWMALLGTGFVYWASRAFWRQGRTFILRSQAKIHLTILAALLLAAKIWDYALARQGLLLAETGLVTGVDFTAAHVRLPVYTALSWIAAGCVAVLGVGLFRRGARLLLGGVALLLASSFVLGSIAPGVVNALVVGPNRYIREKPYLARHIEMTRKAFGLDRFVTRDYPLGRTAEALSQDSPTITNMRLWDFRTLQLSYEQLQALRQYYTFNDMDIDRYVIGGQKREVMLAARELDTSQLQANAQNWENLHLAYTHGYGLVLNGVSEVNPEGQPVFLVSDIPPRVAPGTGLPPVTRPQVYFGEIQNEYTIAPNALHEFDYPTESEQNITTDYTGKDGVPLDSFWVRLLFALRFGDFKFVLSEYITPESKVQLYRRVADRVRKLAPFLDYDPDPYLVMADGRLYWLIDAYTYSANYPYAARHAGTGINYVRNSVKAVVDAYDGTATFYVVDREDPIIRVWQRVFPRLFTPGDRMPQSIRDHLRYPERLFTIQRDMLLLYHMRDTKTFFQKEDAWAVPTETYMGQEEELAPYYLMLRLPGEADAEFVLMEPLKPSAPRRKNMIAWMAARCDGENYGQVLVYLLPKDRIIYGPIQVEGRIAQNPEISKLMTLWGQQQSSVIRGNLLVLPFAGDFLYVEPVYIVSEQGQQPELKLVVLVYKNSIAYGSNLQEALAQLTGAAPPATPAGPGPGQAAVTEGLTRDQLVRLLEELEQSIRAQQDAIRRQQQILADLRKQVGR